MLFVYRTEAMGFFPLESTTYISYTIHICRDTRVDTWAYWENGWFFQDGRVPSLKFAHAMQGICTLLFHTQMFCCTCLQLVSQETDILTVENHGVSDLSHLDRWLQWLECNNCIAEREASASARVKPIHTFPLCRACTAHITIHPLFMCS